MLFEKIEPHSQLEISCNESKGSELGQIVDNLHSRDAVVLDTGNSKMFDNGKYIIAEGPTRNFYNFSGTLNRITSGYCTLKINNKGWAQYRG